MTLCEGMCVQAWACLFACVRFPYRHGQSWFMLLWLIPRPHVLACPLAYAHTHFATQDALFRNEEYLAPAKAKAISRLAGELCMQLRGVALPLVDAWAIPDHILRAPIGERERWAEMHGLLCLD